MKQKAYFIQITGVVQSVGFRPFIYNIFKRYSGWVKNSKHGVIIYLETSLEQDKLKQKIIKNAPENSVIDSIEISAYNIKKRVFQSFFIRASDDIKNADVSIPPDLGICDKCAFELLDKNNRRFLHSFINCTNCGPRFSIIKETPYDRKKTTMSNFKMCGECHREFEDPANRRFHAQPICCNDCGPTYFLIGEKKVVAEGIDAVKLASSKLRDGAVLLLKGIGGYHLVCDAHNKHAVKKIKSIKKRESKPFAVIAGDIDTVKKHCIVKEIEEKLISSQIKPIVLFKKKKLEFLRDITFDSPYLGVMLPYAPIHILLFYFSHLEFIVATSANFTEKPLIYDDKEALNFPEVDFVLSHNRRIIRPLEDSIVFVNKGKTMIYRAARGVAPVYVNVSIKPGILAMGADLKNNIAISLKNKVVLSQYTGNLEEFENLKRFEKNVDDFLRFFNFKPDVVVMDKHPEYFSSNYAKERYSNLVEIQHHKAHFASVLFENRCEKPAIGVVLDGTGFGDDGNIWGGEFFIKDTFIARVGHIKYMPFAFGDRAIREPYRLAMLWLYEILKEKAFNYPLFEEHKELIPIIKNTRMSKTSSAGRLFDVVSALIGVSKISRYEAESSIKLTYKALQSDTDEIFEYIIEGFDIDFSVTVKEIVSKRYKSAAFLARAFHNTFCRAVVENALNISKDAGIETVALGGGVFQNEIVFKKVYKGLSKMGLNVITNTRVPINDGGVALGQIYLANL